MLDDGGTRWLSQGFSAGEEENRWDAKYPPISTAKHSAHGWGDMTQSRCTTICPFSPLCNVHVFWIPFFPPRSPSFVSRTCILYRHVSNLACSAPNTIKFCNYIGGKKKNWACLAQLVPYKPIPLPAFLVHFKLFLEGIILDWAK